MKTLAPTPLNSVLIASLLSVSPSLSALQLTAEVGYDSNPFEISDPDSGDQFTAWRISYEGAKELPQRRKLQYSASLEGRNYDRLEDADEYRLRGRLRWVNRFKIGKRSANFMLTGDIRSERQTYFSVTQRQVAETREGDSLQDRFDYDSGKLSGEFIYRFSRQASLSLYSYIDRRNYVEDYENLGQESLDYSEYALQPTFRYKAKNGSYFRLFVYRKTRDYDSLMNDAVEGGNLNSVLSYQFDGLGISMKYPLSQQWNLSAYFHAYNARDNAQGYRDLDYRRLQVTATFDNHTQGLWSWVGDCYERDYLEDSYRPPESETGDRGRLREGCSLSATYENALWMVDDTTWHVKVSHAFEDNSDDAFSFQRETIAVGLTHTF